MSILKQKNQFGCEFFVGFNQKPLLEFNSKSFLGMICNVLFVQHCQILPTSDDMQPVIIRDLLILLIILLKTDIIYRQLYANHLFYICNLQSFVYDWCKQNSSTLHTFDIFMHYNGNCNLNHNFNHITLSIQEVHHGYKNTCC